MRRHSVILLVLIPVALALIVGTLLVTGLARGESCHIQSRAPGNAELKSIGIAAIRAESRLQTDDSTVESAASGDPLARHYRSLLEQRGPDLLQRRRAVGRTYRSASVDLESVCITRGLRSASVRMNALVRYEESGTPLTPTSSTERYILSFRRQAGGWQLTQVRNPSEFSPGG